jgi:putative heme transporter
MAALMESPPRRIRSAGACEQRVTVTPEQPALSFDARAFARRAALPAAIAAAVAVAAVAAGGPLQAFAGALRRALDADPRWVVAGAIFEAASFAGYIFLLWLAGSRATERLGLRESVHVTLGGAAATRLLPTAGVGGAALTLWALRRAGLGARAAARTLLSFLVVLYSVFLAGIVVSGALIATGAAGARGPLALSAVPAGAAALGIAIPLMLAALARRPWEGPSGRLARVRDGARVMGEAVGDALRLVATRDPRLLGALAWWGFDAAVLCAMLQAFGAPPAIAVVILAYFVGQVGNTIPVPGAVSGGMVGVLLAFGVQAELALSAVLAYRAVAIWLPAPVGLIGLGGLKRTIAGWREPEAPRAPAPRPVVEPVLQPA